ncbi:rhodopsin-like [Ptychodera flava]|uniref:rhodopsin-like n=1 Tax=Ptychodera flava TaxID=63121 RepID=UPI00396A20CA
MENVTANSTDVIDIAITTTGIATALQDIPPPYLLLSIGLYLTVMGTIGFVGNGVVVYLFSRTKYLQTPGNMLIVNLALSDLLMDITNFPPMVISCFYGRWMFFGNIGCLFYSVSGSQFGIMSIVTMTMIAYDRSYVICNPMKATRTVTKKRSLLMIVGIWLYCLFFAISPLLGFGGYIFESYETSCTFDYLTKTTINITFVSLLYVGAFVLPLLIIFYCYSKMIIMLRKHRQKLNKIQEKVAKKGEKNKTMSTMKRQLKESKKEFAIAKIALYLITLFLLSWIPYASVCVIGMYIDASILTAVMTFLPVVFAKSSCVYNPIVYAITHEKFQKALGERFGDTFPCLKNLGKKKKKRKAAKKPKQVGRKGARRRMSLQSDEGLEERTTSEEDDFSESQAGSESQSESQSYSTDGESPPTVSRMQHIKREVDERMNVVSASAASANPSPTRTPLQHGGQTQQPPTMGSQVANDVPKPKAEAVPVKTGNPSTIGVQTSFAISTGTMTEDDMHGDARSLSNIEPAVSSGGQNENRPASPDETKRPESNASGQVDTKGENPNRGDTQNTSIDDGEDDLKTSGKTSPKLRPSSIKKIKNRIDSLKSKNQTGVDNKAYIVTEEEHQTTCL